MSRRALWANPQFWTSPIRIGGHHYARLLAESGWDVAFCSDPISPFHLLRWSRWGEISERLRIWRQGGGWDLQGRLFHLTPFTLWPHANLPLLRSRWSLRNWHRLTIPRLRRLLERRGFAAPDLLVIDSVLQSFWLEVLQPRRTLLRIVDDIAGFQGVTAALLDREGELIARVDHVVYTARRLAGKIAAARPRAMTYVPNGVDLDHFRSSTDEEPPEYAHIPVPRALYVGTLDHWFDVDLVAAAAAARPDVSFVLIGPQYTNLDALRGRANIHLLGRRPYAGIPRYMKAAQVGLIPFRVSDMVHATNPVKLYEYMACGLPVVAVAWDELEELRSPALLARTRDEFIAAVCRALGGAVPRQALVDFAAQADWRNRFRLISEALGL
jgi:glycosyltransferase involved in cell wall biosynthesis